MSVDLGLCGLNFDGGKCWSCWLFVILDLACLYFYHDW